MTTTQKIALIPATLALMLGGGALMSYAGLASAQTPAQSGSATSTPMGIHQGMRGHWGKGPGMGMHGAVGTVSAVQGTTITVTGKDGTTYTVDASNAKVDKIVQLTVSDIKVGDTIGVEGKVSGSLVTAGHIMDGIPANPPQQPQQ